MPKKGSADDDLLSALPEAEEEGDEEGSNGTSAAEVAVRGKGRTVADALKKAGLKGQAKDVKGKFNDLLRNPTNKIVASRISPRQMRGPDGKPRDCSESVDLPPPMSMEEVTQYLSEEYGGKKWNITVLDEDGEVVDRRNIDVPGEPKYRHRTEDDFQIPDLTDLTGEGGGQPEPEQDPMDREIANAEKQSRLLMVERQNAQLRAQLAEARGEHKKNGDVSFEDKLKAALAEQEARHRAELAERDKRAEMSSMEQRITDATSRQIGEMRSLIEKMQAGNPQQVSALSDLTHKLEILQTSIDTKIDKALGQYREQTNLQINALEKGLDGKLSALQTTLASMQNHKPDDPLKSIVPLIVSSIERSTSGYKEMMGPLIMHMTAKEERENAPNNPLEDTLETLGKFNLLGDKKSGDFGSRVVDFAEKMAPEVLAFVREEKSKGREVTEAAIRNHLKLQAEKISREASATVKQEINRLEHRVVQRIATLPTPASPGAAPAQVPSPVGLISKAELDARQRAAAPPPAATQPVVQQQPAAAPPQPAQPPVSKSEPEPDDGEDDGDEEAEEMTPEEEMAARVNSTLSILEREMKIRPRQVTWPNAAWDDLPGAVLDQIIFATDEEDVYKAIQPYADPALSERIWNMVRSNPQAKEFIVAGVNLIKGWAVEVQRKQQEAAAAAGGAAPEVPAAGAEGA